MAISAQKICSRYHRWNRRFWPLVPVLASVAFSTTLSMASAQTTGPLTADTVTTAAETTVAATSAPAATPARDDSDTTHAITLLGEKSGLNPESPRKGPLPDLMGAATAVLGSDVTDFTATNITLEKTAEAVKLPTQVQTDVAVIFAGYSDEKTDVSEDAMKQSLRDIASALKKRNPKMRVFLVPSATYVGTLTGANLRLAAQDAGMTFIPLGTEVGGEPFREAMREIASELDPAAKDANAARPVATEPTDNRPEQTLSPLQQMPQPPEKPAALSTPVVPAQAAPLSSGQADLKNELQRIAGQDDDAPVALTTGTDGGNTTDSETVSLDGQTTDGLQIPPGGQVVKRGKEAHQEVNMKPLPALRAFEPQIPVPRIQIEKKEPALSR